MNDASTPPPVTVYSTESCPYCIRARRLLRRRGVDYTLIDVEIDPPRRQEMETRSGRESVPQIFIGEHHVGGYDDLAELDLLGELDALLER